MADWYNKKLFRDQSILPRPVETKPFLSSQLRAARALEPVHGGAWQPREAIFYKQARLLANYEDDYLYEKPVAYYFPTYQSLSDGELRAYFAWRTRLRRGDIRKTSTAYAFLYIFELLNQIDVTDPLDGYWKLRGFQLAYGQLDDIIIPHLEKWLVDYVVYYGLSAELLGDLPHLALDSSVAILADLPAHDDEAIIRAVHTLAPQWIERSKFCTQHSAVYNKLLCRVLRKMHAHYAKGCKRSMTEYFFGNLEEYPLQLFHAAVFYDRRREHNCRYNLTPVCTYHCRNGTWFVEKHTRQPRNSRQLVTLTKAIDAQLRESLADPTPIQNDLTVKWLLKLIREEAEALLAEQKAAEAKKVSIDFSRLEQIRRDAAITRDKLIVEEELPEADIPEPPQTQQTPAAPPSDTPLNPREYRLLQSLLYGRDIGWVQAEGLMLSVLTDGINDKLYDTFSDTVLDDAGQPLEDYIDDLKEMILP